MIAEKQNAHSDWIRSVQFSPNGAMIVSGSDDGTIKVWGAPLPPIASPNFPITDQSCTEHHSR